MGIVVHKLKIFEAEVEQIGHRGIDLHLRLRTGRTGELQHRLFDVVVVKMSIAQRVHEVTRQQTRDLRDHHRQQRVGSDVKGHAQKHVGTALIKLTGKASFGHVELKQQMARRQCHLRNIGGVPSRHDQSPRIGIRANRFHNLSNLIDTPAIGRDPRPPLLAVDGAELAIIVGPFIPNCDLVLVEITNIRFSAQKPEQLVNDRPQVELLGREQRKALAQIEPHLVAKHAARAGARAVAFDDAVIENVLQQVEILLHIEIISRRVAEQVSLRLSVKNSLLFGHEFFDNFGDQRGIVLFA